MHSNSALGRLSATEFTLWLREPARVVITVALPLGLMIIFGCLPFYQKTYPDHGSLDLFAIYVPILITFGVLAATFSIPAVLATYRERGVLRRLETTPAGPVRLLAAQLAVYAGISVALTVLLLAVARLGFASPLPRQLGGFTITMLLTIAAMISIALFVAAVTPSSRTAQAVSQLLFYPFMFFAGLFYPVQSMPAFLQHLAHATPLGAADAAFSSTQQGQWPAWLPLVTLAIYAVTCAVAAGRLFRWE
jgi:ABC-2 type transport system permease protein